MNLQAGNHPYKLRFDDFFVWRCETGIYFSGGDEISFEGVTEFIGNGPTGAMNFPFSNFMRVVFTDLRCYSEASYTSPQAILFSSSGLAEVVVLKGDFGTAAGGSRAAHTTSSIRINSTALITRMTLEDCLFADPTLLNGTILGGYFAMLKYNRTAGDHRLHLRGNAIIKSQTSVAVAGSAIQMTPITAAYKLPTDGWMRERGFAVEVASGQAVTFSADVRKSATYNGAAPRLLVRANPVLGITADTVLDTHTAAVDTWETLTGTTSAVTGDGILRFVVDCDGTAGSVYVDTLEAS
jgi:hypothetical protein